MDTTSDPRTHPAPDVVRGRPAATNGDTGSAAVKRREERPAEQQSNTFLDSLLRALSVWSS